MQRRLQAVVLGAALATVAGCASNVSTDYNPNAGFAKSAHLRAGDADGQKVAPAAGAGPVGTP
jgi:hypothetical protein